MSAYANDSRVTVLVCGHGCVKVDGGNGVVYVGPGQLGGFVAWDDGQEPDGTGFDSLDEAIRSRIGDPQ
ncbi:hypothetical protein [Catenuloplanes japonicus]|uniref:hypothetical protein n=1 Tax=Catenuloplanes japonicus TaxID=33876 RepID=UPI0005252DC2|nr:hypothetical protein [Catenuloplanes japonicus]